MRALLVGLAISAFGVDAAVAEQRGLELPEFSAISASAGMEVQVAVGGPQSVVLDGNPADFDRVSVKVVQGVLRVSPKSGSGFDWFRSGPDVKVKVTAPRIASLEASSAADIVAAGFAGGDLRLKASSGADLSASGACGRLDADASSGADIDASGLACAFVSAEASSGADLLARAAADMEAAASSGADVIIKGAPGRLRQSNSSGGDVRIEG